MEPNKEGCVIRVRNGIAFHISKEGIEVWNSSMGFPLLMTDVPLDRIRQEPEYAMEVILGMAKLLKEEQENG